MQLSVLIHAIASLICFAAASADALAVSADTENPEGRHRVTSGIEEVPPSEPTGVGAGIVLDEHLLTNGFAGARAKLRVYNAFLQGQFRHSDLTYGKGDLSKALADVWAGVEWRTSSGWALQYLARWESPELRWGPASRSFTWGSIEISKSFR